MAKINDSFLVVSNYNYPLDWVLQYSNEYFVMDRSESPVFTSMLPPERVKYVANVGSDIYDKFWWIESNYDNLPEVVIMTKGNVWKYITKPEFEAVMNNKEFTPLLTKNHKEKMCDWNPTKLFCFYRDGIYWEYNNLWYLSAHPIKYHPHPLMELLGIDKMEYVPFAPGSGYVVPRENIRKHPKEFYREIRGYLDWAVYPGEAQLVERALYTIWK